jgi:reactive intermediate/imine deaminase
MKKIIFIFCILIFSKVFSMDVEHFVSDETEKYGYPFSDAVRVANIVFLSGVLGSGEDGNLVEGGIVPEAHQAFKNMEGTLAKFNLGFDDIFKCLVMIDDISQWGLFNSVYTQYFKKPYPARSAFGADGLALNASFEMECIARIPD